MTRFVLFVASLALVPAAATAQAPPTPPAPPAPVAAPMPPTPPMPPVPPVPAAVPRAFVFDGMEDLRLEIDRELALKMSDVARVEAQVADIARQEAAIARQVEVIARQGSSGNDAYSRGLDAFQRRQYDSAVTQFDRVVTAGSGRVDGALYWKSFAQFRLGQRDNALATIAQLRKDHAQSRYLTDARVLEAEIRKQSGQTLDPASLDNDEIKLLAIQGLQRSEQVVPALQDVLNAANSLAVKKRALYVLALSDDTRAQQVLMQYAKGSGTPDLQIEAVRYLGARRDNQTTSQTLREIYTGTTDPSVKREVISALRSARITVAVPVNPANPTAQATSRSASNPAAVDNLVAIYNAESDPTLRREIIAAIASMSGGVPRVIPLIRGEKDATVTIRAVNALGGQRNAEATQALVDLYGSITDVPTRESVINAIGSQRNAEALVSLARKETNITLKTAIVRRLSDMASQSKVAADYLAEVLK